MLMIDAPIIQAGDQLAPPAEYIELNRLLCAAVVSKSFRSMLMSNPEIAVTSGYQGEKFNLSDADRSWLYSIRPANLVDLAAEMVNYQQQSTQESRIPVPAETQYIRVN